MIAIGVGLGNAIKWEMRALVTFDRTLKYLNVPAGTLRNRASKFDDCYRVSFQERHKVGNCEH